MIGSVDSKLQTLTLARGTLAYILTPLSLELDTVSALERAVVALPLNQMNRLYVAIEGVLALFRLAIDGRALVAVNSLNYGQKSDK